MALRSFRFSCVGVALAASLFGCAQGATETGEVPPLDGLDTGRGGDAASGDGSGDGSGGGDTSGGSDTAAADTRVDSACDPGAGLTITCGVGECTVTMPACSETGTANTCKPKEPGKEVCNGKDDNCNGLIDEELGETECGVGECKTTQKNCVDGASKGCVPKMPGVEVCDGKDNDCNGMIDDGLGSTTCGVGECKITVDNCSGGKVNTCTPKAPGVETCNLKDDDCDGIVDNNIPDISCGSGICKATVKGCLAGVAGVCIPGEAGLETCGVGECVVTQAKCIGGVPQTCTPKAGTPETCNGKDDNCDGIIDNGPSATLCPPPANAATTACASGSCTIASCNPGFADPDGSYSNGCECADSTTPHTCATARDIGTVGVGSVKTFSGNNPVVGRDDWFRVTFINARSDKLSHPHVELTVGAASFTFEIQQSSCSGAIPPCGLAGEGAASDKSDWETSYGASATGSSVDPLWGPILPAAYAAGGNNAVIYIRLASKPSAPATCLPYTLTISN